MYPAQVESFQNKAILFEKRTLPLVEARAQSETVPRDAVLNALERVIESNIFYQSVRLSRFLRFTVEQTLDGFSSNCKEYTIAIDVYERRADFDPGQDTIVRSEARRLRKKLEEYYGKDGKKDEVIICFRPGSYVPLIRWRTKVENDPQQPAQAVKLWTSDQEMQVLVRPLVSPVDDAPAAAIAFDLSEGILLRLMQQSGIRVLYRPSAEQQQTMAESDGPRIIIDGTVRTVQGQLRVQARTSTANGLVLWSQRFNVEQEASSAIDVADVVAASIVSRVAPQGALLRDCCPNNSYSFYSEALAAENLLNQGTISSITTALEKFETLAVKAPGYVRPHYGIAQCCVSLVEHGTEDWQSLHLRGRKACLEALSSSPARCMPVPLWVAC